MTRGGVLRVRLMHRSDGMIQFVALLSITQIRSMFKSIGFMPFGHIKFSEDFQYVKMSLNEQ